MTLRMLLSILMDSPLYWTMTLSSRWAHLNFVLQTYGMRLS